MFWGNIEFRISNLNPKHSVTKVINQELSVHPTPFHQISDYKKQRFKNLGLLPHYHFKRTYLNGLFYQNQIFLSPSLLCPVLPSAFAVTACLNCHWQYCSILEQEQRKPISPPFTEEEITQSSASDYQQVMSGMSF